MVIYNSLNILTNYYIGHSTTWRTQVIDEQSDKVELAIDETTKDTIAIEVTTTAWGDSEILPGLLDQVEGEIAQVSADGAYDSHGRHAAIAERNARPPFRHATVRSRGEMTPPRDAILQEIETKGLCAWQNDSRYHRCSIAENMMFRFKQLGDSPHSRTFERQVDAPHVRAAMRKSFTYLGNRNLAG